MLFGKLHCISKLSEQQIVHMFNLMQAYYDNILWDNFVSDLKTKQEVILFYDTNDNKCLNGFTTIEICLYDEKNQLVFSGDTIIQQKYWGNNNLPQIWLQNAMNHSKKFHGDTYWLLFTKGYKTYKFLHTFFNSFYPCYEKETPNNIQSIIDGFSIKRYGHKYSNDILKASKDYLKKEFAQIDEIKIKNKHTAFFVQKNPDYMLGDELVCITKLSLDNLNDMGRKLLET